MHLAFNKFNIYRLQLNNFIDTTPTLILTDTTLIFLQIQLYKQNSEKDNRARIYINQNKNLLKRRKQLRYKKQQN